MKILNEALPIYISRSESERVLSAVE